MQNQSFSSDPPPLFTNRQQPYSTRISTIQKQLNILCCQHDSLMPLLDISSYQSLLYRWEQNLRNIHKKINQYENKVNQILQKQQRIEQQPINYHSHKILSLSKIKANLKQIKQKLSEITPQTTNLYHQQGKQQNNIKNSATIKTISPLQHFKIQNQQSVQQIKRYTQTSLALFKNQILLQQLSENNKLQNSRSLSQHSNGQQQIVQKFKQSVFHQLRKEVQCLRNGLKGRDGDKQFYQFTIDRIGCDLIEINQVLQNLLESKQQNQRDKNINFLQEDKNKEELNFIKQKTKLIGWQIRGIKKKYLLILSNRFQNQSDGFQVKSLQKNVVKDTNTLQNAYRQIQAKIEYLINHKDQ